MRTVVQGLVGTVLLAFSATASALLIDFESYADGQNLHGVNLGGVTLTNPSGSIEVFDDRFGVGFRSGTKAIGSFNGPETINPLVGVFDSAVSFVSLWAGDAGNDLDNWTLNLYDATVGGNLLGSFNSGDWSGDPYRQLSGSFANIWRFEATWNGPTCCGIGFDDLEFRFSETPTVPAPSILTLFFIAMASLRALQHKT